MASAWIPWVPVLGSQPPCWEQVWPRGKAVLVFQLTASTDHQTSQGWPSGGPALLCAPPPRPPLPVRIPDPQTTRGHKGFLPAGAKSATVDKQYRGLRDLSAGISCRWRKVSEVTELGTLQLIPSFLFTDGPLLCLSLSCDDIHS